MEPPDTFLRNSNHPLAQRSSAEKAVEKPSQIEDVPTEDTMKKKTPAAFQLPSKIIPDDAGHIKVSSP
jgi:CO dehydrogenase/acetyl-CoA synthase beta subunit